MGCLWRFLAVFASTVLGCLMVNELSVDRLGADIKVSGVSGEGMGVTQMFDAELLCGVAGGELSLGDGLGGVVGEEGLELPANDDLGE